MEDKDGTQREGINLCVTHPSFDYDNDLDLEILLAEEEDGLLSLFMDMDIEGHVLMLCRQLLPSI